MLINTLFTVAALMSQDTPVDVITEAEVVAYISSPTGREDCEYIYNDYWFVYESFLDVGYVEVEEMMDVYLTMLVSNSKDIIEDVNGYNTVMSPEAEYVFEEWAFGCGLTGWAS